MAAGCRKAAESSLDERLWAGIVFGILSIYLKISVRNNVKMSALQMFLVPFMIIMILK